MNRERAIQLYKGLLDAFDSGEHGDYFYDHSEELCEAAILAHDAMIKENERLNPKPLTLAELRERDGKPVYIVSGCKNDELKGWVIVSASKHSIEQTAEDIWSISLFNEYDELNPDQDFYGLTCGGKQAGWCNAETCQYNLHLLGWLAYDSPPKLTP